MLQQAIIYTDGSSGKHGDGGWAALIATKDRIVEIAGWEDNTTNNRMEMIAVIRGLDYLTEPHKVFLASDSAYIINTIQNKWYDRWFEKDLEWKKKYANNPKKKKRERPNTDLWIRILDMVKYHDITPIKVKGHSDDLLNRKVDKLASNARLGKLNYVKIWNNPEEGFISAEPST